MINNFTISYLRDVREKNNISLSKLAKDTGIRVSRLKKYENGDLNPRPSTIEKISKSLGLIEKENDADKGEEKENDYQLDVVNQKFDEEVYKELCSQLNFYCTTLLNHISSSVSSDSNSASNSDPSSELDTKIDSRDFMKLLNTIDKMCLLVKSTFSNSSVSDSPFDELLIAFTIKNTLSDFINGFNHLKMVNLFLDKIDIFDDNVLHIRKIVRECLHNLRYVIFYLNDYFKLESDTMFILEKMDGTIYTINSFMNK